MPFVLDASYCSKTESQYIHLLMKLIKAASLFSLFFYEFFFRIRQIPLNKASRLSWSNISATHVIIIHASLSKIKKRRQTDQKDETKWSEEYGNLTVNDVLKTLKR